MTPFTRKRSTCDQTAARTAGSSLLNGFFLHASGFNFHSRRFRQLTLNSMKLMKPTIDIDFRSQGARPLLFSDFNHYPFFPLKLDHFYISF
jgi:hypothetical protein